MNPLKPLRKIGSLVVALGTLAATAVRTARSKASSVLTVPGSTQGALIPAELKRAFLIAVGAASVAGGLTEAFTFLSTDEPFLNALAPVVQFGLAKFGLVAIPLPLIVSGIAFALARSAALSALFKKGEAPVVAKLAPSLALGTSTLEPGPILSCARLGSPECPIDCVRAIVIDGPNIGVLDRAAAIIESQAYGVRLQYRFGHEDRPEIRLHLDGTDEHLEPFAFEIARALCNVEGEPATVRLIHEVAGPVIA